MALGLLAACELSQTGTGATGDTVDKAPPTRSLASLSIERHFARVQADLLSRGLLRTEIASADAPLSPRRLATDFERIALYDEYVAMGGALIARPTKSRLRRWEKAVRMGVTFGPRVEPAKRERDLAEIRRFAARLSRATGHPVTVTDPSQANFQIFIVHEDDRREIGPRLQALVPETGPRELATIVNMPRSTFCLVFALSQGEQSVYSKAVAVIRAEHPDLLRRSCIHEELAQGMGLANDSPQARPSIFNDDEEFALLTTHDELLLRMLYDRRLKPGMTPETAKPLVDMLAAELLGGRS